MLPTQTPQQNTNSRRRIFRPVKKTSNCAQHSIDEAVFRLSETPKWRFRALGVIHEFSRPKFRHLYFRRRNQPVGCVSWSERNSSSCWQSTYDSLPQSESVWKWSNLNTVQAWKIFSYIMLLYEILLSNMAVELILLLLHVGQFLPFQTSASMPTKIFCGFPPTKLQGNTLY